MPAGTVTTIPEMDAAEALLELQLGSNDSHEFRIEGNNSGDFFSSKDNEIIESAASTFLNILFSEIPKTRTENDPQHDITAQHDLVSSKRNSNIELWNYSKHQKLTTFKTKHDQKKGTCKKIKRTRDVGTQTDFDYKVPKIDAMKTIITDLYTKIRNLESQLKSDANPCLSVIEQDTEESEEKTYPNRSLTIVARKNKDTNHFEMSSNMSDEDVNCSFDEQEDKDYHPTKTLSKQKIKLNSADMVAIGDGHATVPARLLKQIDWNSYTNATRKLLAAVFPRRVLATHSLTGKPSPAFPDKPAKKKLNSSLVNDIVSTVVEKCRVPENVVRTSITTKCADESKMFRSRLQNKKIVKKNQENVPPVKFRMSF